MSRLMCILSSSHVSGWLDSVSVIAEINGSLSHQFSISASTLCPPTEVCTPKSMIAGDDVKVRVDEGAISWDWLLTTLLVDATLVKSGLG